MRTPYCICPRATGTCKRTYAHTQGKVYCDFCANPEFYKVCLFVYVGWVRVAHTYTKLARYIHCTYRIHTYLHTRYIHIEHIHMYRSHSHVTQTFFWLSIPATYLYLYACVSIYLVYIFLEIYVHAHMHTRIYVYMYISYMYHTYSD